LILSNVTEAQVKDMSLKNQILSLETHDFYIDSVIDGSNQNGCIGFVLRGIDLRQTPAYFEQPFCNELLDFFSTNIPKHNGDRPLIICINKLLVSEYEVSEIFINVVEINISFLISRDGHYFEIFRGGANSDREGMGTGSKERNIALTLFYIFDDFIFRSTQATLYEKEIVLNNPAGGIAPESFKIEQVKDTIKGIFYSLYDFLEYNIDTLARFRIDYIPPTEKRPEGANPKWIHDNSSIADIWGFSDGHRFYMRVNNEYYPLYQKDSHYRVTAYKKGTSFGDLGPLIGLSLFAGVAGAAFGVMVIPIANIEKAEIMELQVELQSGLIMPSDFTDYKEMNSRIVIYLSKYLKPDVSMDVIADGELLCTLTRNSYYFLRLSPENTQVELCLNASGQQLCEKIQVLPYESRVYLCKVKEGEAPVKEELGQTMRLNILEKVNSGEITRSCINY
jgi:hypothetical protein